MIKKVVLAVTCAVGLLGAAALLSTPAEAKNCPRGSHLIVCPTGSWCCPDGALCVCL